MAGFRRAAGGVSARFTAAEAGIIRSLVSQIAELVGGADAAAGPPGPADPGPAGPGAAGGAGDVTAAFGQDEFAALLAQPAIVTPPDDPVLARLLPDAYRDDAGAAADFRRYTEQGLRSGKVAAARTVLATLPPAGGRVRLPAADAQAWLRAINDVRLALGVRLEITDDGEHERRSYAPGDPRGAYLQVYDWLTYVQETLVRALW